MLVNENSYKLKLIIQQKYTPVGNVGEKFYILDIMTRTDILTH